jgi:iron complex outermembrane receptor protein
MIRLFTTSLLLLAIVPAWGQTITGLVQDSINQPLPFSIVKLLRTADSSLAQGTIAGENGTYTFAGVADGSYRVQASGVGVTTALSAAVVVRAGLPLTVEPLTLRVASQTLAAVTVRTQKRYIEQQADKTVLNVDADATAQGKTAYELLQQAPGVAIDPNDNIRMAGKQGVLVLINGKPTNLSAADLANLLRATPASTIDKVELITNPSARYDAQGGAGIININFRRDKTLGLTGNASGGYGQSDHYRANVAADVNYRAKRLNLFGNVALSDNFQLTNVRYDRNTNGGRFLQRGYDSDGTRAVVYKAGADYLVGSRHTFGVIVSGNAGQNRFGTFTTTDILTNPTRIVADTTILNRVDNPSRNSRINTAFNYRYADTIGLELNLDADFTGFGNTSPNTITSDYVGQTERPLFTRRTRFDATTDITILTLKSDLVKVWKSRVWPDASVKLETGLKHTDVQTNNDLLAFTGAPEQPDLNRTNRFVYRERVSAAYASVNRSVGKLTMQGGLRAEYANVRGQSTDLLNRTINRPDTTYLNLFPTAFVQYQATQKSQVGLNYGRRIGRPNYQDLNPFIYQIDPYTSQRGNPFLRPNYTHNAELSYTYNYATTLKLALSRTNDYATDIIRQDGLAAYQTVANVGRVDALNLSFSTPYQVTKWWSSYVYAGATWNRFVGRFSPTEPFDQRAFAFEGYMQHTFTLSPLWLVQVSGFWNAPTTQTIYRIGGLRALNLSVQKKVWEGRGKITFTVDDVLNTMRWRQAGDAGNQQFDIYRKWESRRVSVRFTYRFGNQNVKAARSRETGADASRIKTKGNL